MDMAWFNMEYDDPIYQPVVLPLFPEIKAYG